jgi:hypothetical protein
MQNTVSYIKYGTADKDGYLSGIYYRIEVQGDIHYKWEEGQQDKWSYSKIIALSCGTIIKFNCEGYGDNFVGNEMSCDILCNGNTESVSVLETDEDDTFFRRIDVVINTEDKLRWAVEIESGILDENEINNYSY